METQIFFSGDGSMDADHRDTASCLNKKPCSAEIKIKKTLRVAGRAADVWGEGLL